MKCNKIKQLLIIYIYIKVGHFWESVHHVSVEEDADQSQVLAFCH